MIEDSPPSSSAIVPASEGSPDDEVVYLGTQSRKAPTQSCIESYLDSNSEEDARIRLVRNLSTRALKRELTAAGISFEHCIEKGDLQRLLIAEGKPE